MLIKNMRIFQKDMEILSTATCVDMSDWGSYGHLEDEPRLAAGALATIAMLQDSLMSSIRCVWDFRDGAVRFAILDDHGNRNIDVAVKRYGISSEIAMDLFSADRYSIEPRRDDVVERMRTLFEFDEVEEEYVGRFDSNIRIDFALSQWNRIKRVHDDLMRHALLST